MGKYSSLKVMLIFLSITAFFRILIQALGLVELSGDEAQYWDWSRRMDWCFYSKPPGVAALIYAGTHIFGNNELGVRFMAIVCSFIASIAMYLLGKEMYNERTGCIAAVLFQVVPAFGLYGIGMTPDSPLIMFWCWSLLFFYQAVEKGRKRYWAGLTVSIGLAMLCKYAIVFFIVPAFLYMFFSENGRKALRGPWPYISILSSFVFFIPVIYWNSQNNWVTFRHDLGHTNIAEGVSFSFGYLISFLGGQLMIVTPVTAVLIVVLLIIKRKSYSLGFWFCIPILICFLIKSIQGKVQPNWVATAWIAGIVPMADYFVSGYLELDVKNRWRNLSRSAVSIPAVIMIILHMPFLVELVPWPNDLNPVRKLTGWRQLASAADAKRAEMESPFFVLTDYYMVTAEMAFYCEGNPEVYYINTGNTRMNQYDLWQDLNEKKGENAIFIPRKGIKDIVYELFDRVEVEDCPITDIYGRAIQTYKICKCYGFKGIESHGNDRY